MTESIRRDIFFPHPPERVWRALTDSSALGKWLMPNNFEPKVGHLFTFRTDPVPPHFDGIVHCRVTELNPPWRLSYGGPLTETVVTYRLEPERGGTRLHFRHDGFDVSDPGQRMAYETMSGVERHQEQGLKRVLEELAAVA